MFSAITRSTLQNLTGALCLTAFLFPAARVRAQEPPPPPPGASRGLLPRPPADPAYATQQDAGDAVQRAYDAIGRSAVLAGNGGEGVSSLLSESRNAYQQALSAYQANNFVGARESAMMSTDLARASEQLATAHFIAASAGQAAVPTPPQSVAAPDRAALVYNDLARLSQHRADITAKLATWPQSANAEVRGLMEVSARLQTRAQTLLGSQKPDEAGAVARAADALLAASDHSLQRVLIASGTVAAPAAPAAPATPPPAPGAAPPPPPPPQP